MMWDGRGGGGTRSLARLVIPRDLYDAMLDHLFAACPQEGCGLLATEGERAVRLFPGANLAASATSYTMDPREVLGALLEIEARGWRLGAIFHSHPDGPAWPSATDLREAYYPEALTVIVSLAGPAPRAAAFALGDGVAREAPLLID